MIFKLTPSILAALILTACSNDSSKVSETVVMKEIKKDSAKTLEGKVEIKPKGIDLFIDSMKNQNYLLDTARIKQTTWAFLCDYPSSIDNGHIIIQVPFPDDSYKKHFSNPKTYFFAQWNEKEKTFKNGNDYILMTWDIDSAGIRSEEKIYGRLHGVMGNFPCYIFRSNNTVYALGHRMTVHAKNTRILAEQLRAYIDPSCYLYKPFDGEEPR